jgi:ankyrin repeat protein
MIITLIFIFPDEFLFFTACLNGNKLMVKYLCEQGADVNLVDNEFHSLIHWITGRILFLI